MANIHCVIYRQLKIIFILCYYHITFIKILIISGWPSVNVFTNQSFKVKFLYLVTMKPIYKPSWRGFLALLFKPNHLWMVWLFFIWKISAIPFFFSAFNSYRASHVVQLVKDPPAKAGEAGSIPGSGISPGVGNENPLLYSCLENTGVPVVRTYVFQNSVKESPLSERLKNIQRL